MWSKINLINICAYIGVKEVLVLRQDGKQEIDMHLNTEMKWLVVGRMLTFGMEPHLLCLCSLYRWFLG